ncbi:N-acetylglucosamine kinase [Mucilaginibacter sp. UR6-11]|uniref:N-acetylglucosamine kinase n=1 Tax=Mucilaginibacter sp. UR6-11 TaxID=1435644 RepID=UPI001E2BF3B8|nr:N-acetylglucosamine kinase [Mucilaginibacter sp. UR6-11]MCC8426568.1 N-acetylglucosamine kinase [Mucilaginibacter sp. UR6-11]
MILVADSGSTKTDWLLKQPGHDAKAFRTPGLNPYFLTEKEIVKILQDQAPELVTVGTEIKEIYFFGAGCSSPDRHEIVSNALSQLFSKAYISVDSDLLASAYATCGHEKGLCCILGTGSNISFFDGEEIHSGKHGLGFILGDEGAGTWFGKALITDFLYDLMPEEIHTLFNNTYQLTKEEVIVNVYQKPAPNSYLASFARFFNVIRKTEYGKNLINKGLQEFIDTNIKSYPEYHTYKSHFVGSIAFVFADELKALAETQDIHIGKIIKQPINDLLAFILSREEGR